MCSAEWKFESKRVSSAKCERATGRKGKRGVFFFVQNTHKV